MNIEHVKEQLSNRFIGVLAANRGFVIEKGDVDLGVDFQLKRPYARQTPTGEQGIPLTVSTLTFN